MIAGLLVARSSGCSNQESVASVDPGCTCRVSRRGNSLASGSTRNGFRDNFAVKNPSSVHSAPLPPPAPPSTTISTRQRSIMRSPFWSSSLLCLVVHLVHARSSGRPIRSLAFREGSTFFVSATLTGIRDFHFFVNLATRNEARSFTQGFHPSVESNCRVAIPRARDRANDIIVNRANSRRSKLCLRLPGSRISVRRGKN